MNTEKQTLKPETTRRFILDATLELIEREGIGRVTVRKIASRAAVNLAAVNYHFGSKEQVIFAALQSLRTSFGDAFSHLQNSTLTPRERLVAFMKAYCNSVFAYPNLAKAFVTHNLNAKIEQDYADFVRAEGLEQIRRTLAEYQAGNDETLRMKAFQMMSSLILILLVGGETKTVIGLDFSDPEVREHYIQSIVPGEQRKFLRFPSLVRRLWAERKTMRKREVHP